MKGILKSGITIMVAAVTLVASAFSGAMTTTAYARDRRLPAAFFPEFRVNTYDRPGGVINGFFDERTTGARVEQWGFMHANREYWRVSFNLFAGGRATRYIRRYDLIRNNSWTDIILLQDTRVFERSNLARHVGTVWGGQRARDRGNNYSVVLATRGNSVLIVHAIDAGGGRLGWINGRDVEGAVRRSDGAVWRNGGWQVGGGGGQTGAGQQPTGVVGGWTLPSNGSFSDNSWGRTRSHATRTHHVAIDFGGANLPVFAAADGQVVVASNVGGDNGNVIVIRHRLNNGQNIYTFYAHLGAIEVSQNAQVRRGQRIGRNGAPGARWTHLHFSILQQNAVGNGNYWGNAPRFTGNRTTCPCGRTWFNPLFVIRNNRLP